MAKVIIPEHYTPVIDFMESQRAIKNDSEEARVAAANESKEPVSGPKSIPPAITSRLPGIRHRVAMINSAA